MQSKLNNYIFLIYSGLLLIFFLIIGGGPVTNDEIKFIDIPNFIDDVLQSHNACKIDDIDSIFNIINSTKNIILRKLDSK